MKKSMPFDRFGVDKDKDIYILKKLMEGKGCSGLCVCPECPFYVLHMGIPKEFNKVCGGTDEEKKMGAVSFFLLYNYGAKDDLIDVLL
jgi:hypothetical protein